MKIQAFHDQNMFEGGKKLVYINKSNFPILQGDPKDKRICVGAPGRLRMEVRGGQNSPLPTPCAMQLPAHHLEFKLQVLVD